MTYSPQISASLARVGPRIKQVRTDRRVTLAALAADTGISMSTLSRLEAGQRRPSLELLLPIALSLQLPLDELVAAPRISDPRVVTEPRVVSGRTILPLTLQRGGLQAYKLTIPRTQSEPDMTVHEGYEWFYVLSGRLRLILGEQDLLLGPGEVAEFDTTVPHWFGSTGRGAVEVLSLFGPTGQRMHVRAKAL
ncbi:helix-turn-helix domain-containing protein [Rhodococcus sp. OK302]|jgi:transcriptional regulator with XRE-family HTH domain|uniref:helix-turn-helix domain-containing protein n=1 Tax=Rhodococcus sp. OK302 TaxID=1882769 RepID=UPI000B94055F|nr:XRE family transcriptional regulator [Rhodococcus sp. OK302]OYD61018.1 XRE family transcriptional regulator [Rhodococcus sp. OK302]